MVKDRLHELVQKSCSVLAVDDSMSFESDLNIDSLDMVDLLATVESAFDVRIADDQLSKIATVGDLRLHVEELLNAKVRG